MPDDFPSDREDDRSIEQSPDGVTAAPEKPQDSPPPASGGNDGASEEVPGLGSVPGSAAGAGGTGGGGDVDAGAPEADAGL
jgi:hypothetical protein